MPHNTHNLWPNGRKNRVCDALRAPLKRSFKVRHLHAVLAAHVMAQISTNARGTTCREPELQRRAHEQCGRVSDHGECAALCGNPRRSPTRFNMAHGQCSGSDERLNFRGRARRRPRARRLARREATGSTSHTDLVNDPKTFSRMRVADFVGAAVAFAKGLTLRHKR